MAASKIDYEEEFFDGMTVPRLAQLFRLDRRTVTEKLRPLRPTGDGPSQASYVASTLSASLELVKEGALETRQLEAFADIYLRARKELRP